jgi:hypothetical protein
MIVLVESNFVIEFAQRQAEIADAERIVALAENREIELAIPACALFEPYETLIRRRKQRTETVRKLIDEIAQLGRSQHFGTADRIEALVTGRENFMKGLSVSNNEDRNPNGYVHTQKQHRNGHAPRPGNRRHNRVRHLR